MRILRDSLDDDAVVSLDAGNNRVWMCHYFQTKAPKTFFAPGGLAGMGWAMPAALALKLVYPNRQVVGSHRRRRLHDVDPRNSDRGPVQVAPSYTSS